MHIKYIFDEILLSIQNF